jgi:tetratricopeptide (TPR) repeat protein
MNWRAPRTYTNSRQGGVYWAKPFMTKEDHRKGSVAPAKTSAPLASPVPALFRRVDWLAFGLTLVVMWVVYFLTLAPEVTLEDSGELVTGSMYAGIPHPPGYPVWTIYSWLWTVLVPVGNMAWRVALAEAAAGAISCALIALLVSRGSSLLIGSIAALNSMTGRWERAIGIICGVVAGLLLGLDGFMWRESVAVNRIAVSSVPWFMLVLVCLLRWIYAPHQHRYVYWALFIFGICFTTHQSLIVAALGVEVLIAARNPKLGRDIFFGNGVIYFLYMVVLLFSGKHIFHNIGDKPGLLLLFNAIGIGSLAASFWLALRTRGLLTEWKPVLILGLLWMAGASFYFYMPISGMTNPPMQWAYPRTVDGFFHALTRGQYEQPNPVNVLSESGRFIGQLGMLAEGVAESFTWVCVFIALVPFAFLLKLQKRERAWLMGLLAMYFCLGVLLMILLNPAPERASADLVKVFFNSSHTLVALLIGYGLALTAAYMATHYERFRRWGVLGGIIAVILALFSLLDATGRHYFGPAGQIGLSELPRWIGRAFAPNQYGLPIYAHLLLVAIALAFVCALIVYHRRAPLGITLGLFALMPLYSGLSHWFECDQRGHLFGYWFGHDMFSPPFKGADNQPIFPEIARDAILFGGTDPGRFCPTYMVFCESFTPHKCQPAEDQSFDRRDVYVITQNALADPPYLNYIRAHYNRSAQIDPPFFSEFARTMLKDKEYETNLLARVVQPLDQFFTHVGDTVEKRRRTSSSLFSAKDLIDLRGFASELKPAPEQDPLSKFIYENLSAPTQQLVCANGDEGALRRGLAKDLNLLLERELKPGSDAQGTSAVALYSPDRFKHLTLPEYLTDFIAQNPQSHTRIRLNRLLLEAAYPSRLARSLGGVYPDREIHTPTPEERERCCQEYIQDAGRRAQLNQLRPGEDVQIVGNQIQMHGQVAVMGINAAIAKLIFERNPKHEFYVEESMPLDWMYPHLTPNGVIMKVHRQPLTALPEEVLQKDHEFWKQYSKRLTGDIIDYGTPIKQVVQWIEKAYLRYDFNGFTGDRKFIHDSDAQKSFSKLRSAIAGVYAWRLGAQCPPEYRPRNAAEFQRLLKEADFAFLQAFAFCPFSPEAVLRYTSLLLQTNRIEDALLILDTCLKLDPFNAQVLGWANNLRTFKKQQTATPQNQAPQTAAIPAPSALEMELRTNPANAQAAFDLASSYIQSQQSNRAIETLARLLNQPQIETKVLVGLAQAFAQLGDGPGLEKALEKLAVATPESPEAWYDLAALKATLGKSSDALRALSNALELSAKRLQSNASARDLLVEARGDARFDALRKSPNFPK